MEEEESELMKQIVEQLTAQGIPERQQERVLTLINRRVEAERKLERASILSAVRLAVVPVVEAVNSAKTATDAFSLSTSRDMADARKEVVAMRTVWDAEDVARRRSEN